MFFSFIKFFLFLTIVGLVSASSASGDDDSQDSDYDYAYSMAVDDTNDEQVRFEENFQITDLDIANFDEQDLAVMKAVEEIANYKEPYAEIKQDGLDYIENKSFSTIPTDTQSQYDEYEYSDREQSRIFDYHFGVMHIISLALAFLLFVSFIIICIQASKITVTNPQIILYFNYSIFLFQLK